MCTNFRFSLKCSSHLRSFMKQCYSTENMLPQTILNDIMENFCPNTDKGRHQKKKPITIVVEGNIGSGKTTFLKNFDHLYNATIVAEPVSKWTNVAGKHNLLKLMYENPKKNSFNLQTYIQLTMFQNHKLEATTDFKLMERSLYSGRCCFVENLHRSKLLEDVETAILDEWYNHLTSDEDCQVDLFVYLRTRPEIALQRVRRRDRLGETSITLDYLTSLHELHEQWMTGQSSFKLPTNNVIILDANKNENEIMDEFSQKSYKMDSQRAVGL